MPDAKESDKKAYVFSRLNDELKQSYYEFVNDMKKHEKNTTKLMIYHVFD